MSRQADETSRASPILPGVVAQHVDDAAVLRVHRTALVRAPLTGLHALARADERLAAHLDGVALAGAAGTDMSRAALQRAGVGELFVAAVGAIEHKDARQLDRLHSMIDVVPGARRALASAFGWVSAASLRGLTAPLLSASSPASRWLGLTACALHRVHPGAALSRALDDADLPLRLRALKAAGELGDVEMRMRCVAAMNHEDLAVRFTAARAAVLLGERDEAVAVLRDLALTEAPGHEEAMRWFILASSVAQAREFIRALAARKVPQRALIKAAGWAGDIQVIPWLLKQMEDAASARPAGESFLMLTGVELAEFYGTNAPPGSGIPNDDPNDDRVTASEDDGLPWPNRTALERWWAQNGHRFSPGRRYLMGTPIDVEHCLTILRNGTQRQRQAAADHLCMLRAGRPLFNTMSPAWRQQRQLNDMTI